MTLIEYKGHPSLMDRMLHIRTYRMKIRFNIKGLARVSWFNRNIVMIDKVDFIIDDLRTVMHGLCKTAR